MWLFVLFDLPVDTPEARRRYTEFRSLLLDDGYLMLQYSVYARHAPSQENAEVHAQRIRRHLPPDGEVRILTITERQFERMQVFHGAIRGPTEPAPTQLTFF